MDCGKALPIFYHGSAILDENKVVVNIYYILGTVKKKLYINKVIKF